MKFSVEIKELICIFLNFDKTVILSEYISVKKFNKIFNLKYAVYYGHLEIVKFLYKHHQNDYDFFCKTTMNCAVINGHLDIVVWLSFNRSEGCGLFSKVKTTTLDFAAKHGHFEIVKWLHEQSLICSEIKATKEAMNLAALNGHLGIVKLLHENRQNRVKTNTCIGDTNECRLLTYNR